jgi:hypothetical protein
MAACNAIHQCYIKYSKYSLLSWRRARLLFVRTSRANLFRPLSIFRPISYLRDT